MRVVLDTNVVVSALVFRGETARLERAWRRGQVKLFATPAVTAEYARVLSYPKFQLAPEHIAALLGENLLPFVEAAAEFSGRLPHPCADPDDDRFLRAALGGKADWLVTGDAALLRLNGRYAFKIGTAGELLATLSNQTPSNTKAPRRKPRNRTAD